MEDMTYGQAVDQLREWAAMEPQRDDRIVKAYRAHVSKAEIARLTGLSWQTVDRIVRDAGAQRPSASDEEE